MVSANGSTLPFAEPPHALPPSSPPSDSRLHERLGAAAVRAPRHGSSAAAARDEVHLRERHVRDAIDDDNAAAAREASSYALPPLGGAVSFYGIARSLQLDEATWLAHCVRGPSLMGSSADAGARDGYGAGASAGGGASSAATRSYVGTSAGSSAASDAFSRGATALLARHDAERALAALLRPLRPPQPHEQQRRAGGGSGVGGGSGTSCRHVATAWGLRTGRGVRHACAPPHHPSMTLTQLDRSVGARKHWRYGEWLCDTRGGA